MAGGTWMGFYAPSRGKGLNPHGKIIYRMDERTTAKYCVPYVSDEMRH